MDAAREELVEKGGKSFWNVDLDVVRKGTRSKGGRASIDETARHKQATDRRAPGLRSSP
jgi:hypothetical protein